MKKILALSLILILSQVFFAQNTRPENTRMFEPNLGTIYPGFIKHANEDVSQTYYFATLGQNSRQIINKFNTDGTTKWKAYADNGFLNDLTLTSHHISVDNNDNVVYIYDPSAGSTVSNFVASDGVITNLPLDRPTILKLNKEGKVVFTKSINFLTYPNLKNSIYTDSENNIYLVGVNYTSEQSIYIWKISGATGNEIFLKNFNGISVDSAFLLFDSSDNFFLFMDSVPDSNGIYLFDSISIPSHNGSDALMVKFDKNGNVLSGKNFYGTASPGFNYSTLIEGVFDGENLVVIGFLSANRTGDFLGLDNTVIPRKYPNTSYQGLMAKINLDGSVIWQKPIYSTVDLRTGMWTNIDVDTEKNIYGYFPFKNKISYNNVEIQFNATDGNKIVSKFNTNGDNLYFASVLPGKANSSVESTSIDVIGENLYSINGVTYENKFLEYPLLNQNYAKSYIATFGTLSKKYLTPENNYLELTAASIPNNPAPSANEYSFSLVNNVNWTATSDQSWLNLSSISLTSKSPQQTINGNGDAKITLFADQNTTGISRSSNVIISGENVASKTIIVSQGATLGTSNNALSIITLYPNPTSNFLNIKSSQKISKVGIYDMSGKLVKSANLIDENINVESLLKGNYLIKLYTENGVVTSKFIKN